MSGGTRWPQVAAQKKASRRKAAPLAGDAVLFRSPSAPEGVLLCHASHRRATSRVTLPNGAQGSKVAPPPAFEPCASFPVGSPALSRRARSARVARLRGSSQAPAPNGVVARRPRPLRPGTKSRAPAGVGVVVAPGALGTGRPEGSLELAGSRGRRRPHPTAGGGVGGLSGDEVGRCRGRVAPISAQFCPDLTNIWGFDRIWPELSQLWAISANLCTIWARL